MTVTMVMPLFVFVVGAIVYLFAGPKAAELGRIAYFVGLLWAVYLAMGKALHFG